MVDFKKIMADEKRFKEIVELLKEEKGIDVSGFMIFIENRLGYTHSLKLMRIILAVDELD